MFCAYCGEVNNSYDKFCKRCGKQIVNVMPETPVDDVMNARPENNLMGFNPDADSSNDDILMYSRFMKEGRVHDKDDPATQQLRQQEAENIQQKEKTKTKDIIFAILSPFIFILAFYFALFLVSISGIFWLIAPIAGFALFVYYSIIHFTTLYSSIAFHYFRFRHLLVLLVFSVVRMFVPIDNIFSIPLFTILIAVALMLVTDWNKITLNGNCRKRDVLELISVHTYFFTVFECAWMFLFYF